MRHRHRRTRARLAGERHASDGGEGGEARGQPTDRHARGPQDLARAPPPPRHAMHSPSQREADFDLW